MVASPPFGAKPPSIAPPTAIGPNVPTPATVIVYVSHETVEFVSFKKPNSTDASPNGSVSVPSSPQVLTWVVSTVNVPSVSPSLTLVD